MIRIVVSASGDVLGSLSDITPDGVQTFAYVNCTPHDVVLRRGDVDIVFPPCGVRALADVAQTDVSGFPLPTVQTVYGDLVGLPDSQVGVIYITSAAAAVKARSLGRTDVVSPDTGPTAIRDQAGRIQAVIRFQIPS